MLGGRRHRSPRCTRAVDAGGIHLECGLARAAREGVLIKGGQYLEKLVAVVKVISFDKTATLAKGHF